MFFFFFFSSRRRHTRLQGDWSSDVCSSDLSPTLIAGYGLIERQAPPERRTEGMTWLSSAISVGVATGSPLAGHLIDAYGARWGYLLAAVCGSAAVLAG